MTPWYQSPVFILSAISAVSAAVLASAQANQGVVQWVMAGVAALIAVIDTFTSTGKIGE